MSGSPPTPGGRLHPGAVLLVSAALAINALISVWLARASHGWLPVQASDAAPYVDDLFALETGIGCFIFLGCLAVLLWTVLLRRAPKYDLVDGDPIEGNTRLEVVWTLIPLLVVILISAHAINVNGTLDTLGGKQRVRGTDEALATAPSSGGTIEVIARQWSWEFVYPSGVRSAELHLPCGERADLRLVSMDVLHGFYVPAFRLKQDLIPGSVIAYSFTPTREGRYRLRDSMFSGGYMAANQSDVVVESPASYGRWLEEAARQPLRPSRNDAAELYQRRIRSGDRGWATVPPAAPPLVNVDRDPDAVHEA